MAQQKSQAIVQRRFLVLEAIQRLSGRSERWITVSDIVNDLKEQGYAVETHTIRRDMKSLLDTHQHLECNDNSNGNGKAKNGLAFGYRWYGRDQFANGGITLPEALSLVMVERYLSQSLPVLLSRPLHDIFSRAHQVLELHKKSQITHWPEKICVVQPTQPLIAPDVKPTVLAAVHEALLSDKQLQVTYSSTQQNRNDSKEYILHPLGLIQRGSVTYLAAMANDYEDAFFYALHRMKSAQMLDCDCRRKDGFILTEFANTQGHFGNGTTISLKARVSEHLSIILHETPLSANQIISKTGEDGFHELVADVSYTWQLRWWILGEGDRIQVLEPAVLRDEIADAIKNVARFYNSENSISS